MGYGLSRAFLRCQLKVSEFCDFIFSNTNTIPPTATSSRNQKLKLNSTKSQLPENLIFQDILPKLPAKSLVRFKKVSPRWNTFISSVTFAETISSLSSRCVLTLEDDLSFFVVLDYKDEKNLVTKEFEKQFSYDTLCSSCNGLALLVSLFDEMQVFDNLHRTEFNYVVYNPVLGVHHYVEIRHPNDLPLGGNNVNKNYSLGFGYASSSNDYYIVAINFPCEFEVVVYLYSLKSQEWRTRTGTIEVQEESLPLRFQDAWYTDAGTLVKQTLYWGIAQGEDNQFIFAYDLADQDAYELIDLPYANFGESGELQVHSAFSLCCLDDRLCAWANYDPDIVEMWMLEDDEKSESAHSWILLFLFPFYQFPRSFFGSNESGIFLVFNNNDKLILADFHCHPPKLSDAVLDNKWSAVNYVPSLVSVPNIAAVRRA